MIHAWEGWRVVQGLIGLVLRRDGLGEHPLPPETAVTTWLRPTVTDDIDGDPPRSYRDDEASRAAERILGLPNQRTRIEI